MSITKNKKPNAWISAQKGFSTVERVTSDAALKNSIDRMVETNTLPLGHHQDGETLGGLQGRVSKPRVEENGNVRIEFWVDLNDEDRLPFQAKTTDKKTGAIEFYHGSDENDLRLAVLADVAEFKLQQREIEAEYLSEFPELRDPGDFSDPELAAEYIAWINTIHGQEYKSIRCDSAFQMLLAEIQRSGMRVDRYALEKAYCNVIDNPDRAKTFDRFFAKRDRLAQEAAEEATEAKRAAEAQAIADAEEAEQERQIAARQSVTFAELERQENLRLSKTPEGMRELKARILREKQAGRTPTVPSTGMAPRR